MTIEYNKIGFFYLNARYYDPTTQQFTQEDTYWGDGTNLYAYCSGNPVMYSDPSGHYKTVKSGSRGEDVKTLQRILNANGAQLAVDGSFGPKTLAAVKNYQASHGLAVDGSVGPLTWGSLTKSLAPASTSSSSIDDVTDKNLLAYCDNNPIIQTDDSGNFWKELGKGFVDGFVGTFTGIVDALADPLQVIKSVIKTAPLNIADPTGIWRNAYSLGSSIRDKDVYAFGNFTGGKTGEVTVLIAMAGSKALSGFISKGAGETVQGFETFKDLKAVLGSPGENNQWHHIVEQSQINKSGFSPTQIQNVDNIVAVDKILHGKISGYYNTSTFQYTNGLKVRNWLAGQSYETQYEFGLKVLKDFGVTK